MLRLAQVFFLLIMPFGGTTGLITQKYKNIKNNP